MNMKTLRIFVALCFAMLSVFVAQAQDAMAKMKKTYPVAMQEFGEKMSELKTDYIIAIDVSATMGRYKDEVVPALTRFFDSIGDGNYVRIVSFGTIAKEEQTRLEITKQTRPQIVERLNYVYDQVMNDRGMRGHTDFVLMGQKVMDLIQADNDSDIHFVVVFSDIMDDPSQKAKGSNHRSEAEWTKLAQRFNALEVPVNTLSTYFSHESKDEKQILESIDLVNKAFPNFAYSNDINEVLGSMLEDSKFIIYTDKLKQLISNDINELGKKELFTSLIEKDKSLVLQYDFDKEEVMAPKYIRGIEIDTCIMDEKSIDILDVEFENHKEIAKRTVEKNIGAVKFDQGGLFVKDCSTDYRMKYHFIYQVGKDEKALSFTKDMEALGLIDNLPQNTALHADGKFVFIWPFWLIVLLGVLIIVFLFFLVKNTIVPGRIKGKKFYCIDPAGNKTSFWVANERSFTIGGEDEDWNLHQPNVSFKILVKAKNGGPFNLIIKRRVMCYLLSSKSGIAKMTQSEKGKVDKANILVNPVSVEEGLGQKFTFNITDKNND